MKRSFVIGGVILLLSLALTGCSCKHEYDNGEITREATCIEEGEKTFTCTLCKETKVESVPLKEHSYKEKITKEATFKEEGEKTFTCEACGDFYTESIPVRDDEVIVTAINKTNLGKDINARRYSDRVVFTFEITNRGDKSIKGVQGILTICDLFDSKILSINCDFTGNTIDANKSITVSDLGMDINQFMDDHVKLYNTDFSDLKFKYEVTNIVYCDESSVNEQSTTNSAQSQKVTVNVTGKQNLDINYNVGRYSPKVEFSFEVFNHTSKDIKGVQGVLTIKDLFGVDIMSSNLDFTGQNISANGSVRVSGMGIDINQFMDNHVKIYNTDFSDLKFEYKVNSIVYTDGTTE